MRVVQFGELQSKAGRRSAMKYIIGTMVGVAQLGELKPKVQWTFAVQRTPDRSLAGAHSMQSKAGRRSAMK